MLSHLAVPGRGPGLIAMGLGLMLWLAPVTAEAQTQRQWCFYADAQTENGPRFVSDVFCVYGAVDSRDVMRSFGLWRRGRFSAEQVAAWGPARVTSMVFASRERAARSRNALIARYQGGNLSGTPGWTYYPGAAQLAEALGELSDALDVILVDNGIGVSMAMAHGASNALAFGGSIRFGGRWRFHAHNPIEALSLGEVEGPTEGKDATTRQGWGMEILRSFTPRIAVGVGAHHVRVRTLRQDALGNTFAVSEKTTWDPTVSLTLPLGYLPLYFRYGQQSQYSVGMIVDFERSR